MTDATQSELLTRFQAWRKLDPMMNQISWFIGSSIDETGVVWTSKNRMEKVVAGRVQSLAAACLQMLRNSRDNWSTETAAKLFVPPLEDHDFLVTLQKKVLSFGNRRSVSKGVFRNLAVEMETSAESAGFNPVQDLVNELDRLLGGTAIFLYGDSNHAGNTIAGLWRPNTLGTKEWRVRLGWSSQPDNEEAENGDAKCSLNKKGVLKEIELLGKDLIKNVKQLGPT